MADPSCSTTKQEGSKERHYYREGLANEEDFFIMGSVFYVVFLLLQMASCGI